MNKLSIEKRTQVITALVEGNSIRATCRMTGTAKGTVTRLLESAGKACSEYQNEHLRNLNCQHIQCDEVWSFVYAKEKNLPYDKQGQFGYGDAGKCTKGASHYRREVSRYPTIREKELLQEYKNANGVLPRCNDVMP